MNKELKDSFGYNLHCESIVKFPDSKDSKGPQNWSDGKSA
jgi:hypothetical protein